MYSLNLKTINKLKRLINKKPKEKPIQKIIEEKPIQKDEEELPPPKCELEQVKQYNQPKPFVIIQVNNNDLFVEF